jgi:hypothetical protein
MAEIGKIKCSSLEKLTAALKIDGAIKIKGTGRCFRSLPSRSLLTFTVACRHSGVFITNSHELGVRSGIWPRWPVALSPSSLAFLDAGGPPAS